MTLTINPPPHRERRNWAVALLVGQVLTTFAAVVAAAVTIHSIFATGPILSIFGVALAIVGRPWLSAPLTGFGLSAPAVAALGAFVIAFFGLDPHEAVLPIGLILVIYFLLVAPFSMWLYLNVLRYEPSVSKLPSFAWQYSMKSLLGLMTLVAVFTGISVGFALAEFQIVFAFFGLAALMICSFFARQLSVSRSESLGTKDSTSPSRSTTD